MGILNGNVNCDSNTNSLGTSCKYQCDEGFKLVGTDESICSLNEDELGAFWSENPPFCEAYCGPLPELTNGSYECDGNDLGSTCEVKCSNGTRVDGERSLICKQDNAGMAYWFGDMVQCIRTCPQRMIRTPPLKVDCTSGLDVGSYCTFGCTNEAMLHGSKNVKCQIDSNGIAKWSHDFPICRPQCPQIPDREGQRVKCTTGRLGGSECKFSCDPNGWKLAGNTTVQCKIHRERQAIIREERNAHLFDLDPDQDHEMIERAHWSVPNLPSCRRKTCPKLPKLTNGQLACTGYNFEDSCRFECNEGFLLKGENATECLGGFLIDFNAYKLFEKFRKPVKGFGRWSNRLPLCKKKPRSMIGKCEELQSDGIVAIECSQEYYMGSICAFSCPTGYRLIGPSMSTCENDLSWSHEMPLCKVRIVISKWAASKVLKANSRLFQFINDDKKALEDKLVIAKKSTKPVDYEFNWKEYLTSVDCHADICKVTEGCIQTEIKKLKEIIGDEDSFFKSYSKLCVLTF